MQSRFESDLLWYATRGKIFAMNNMYKFVWYLTELNLAKTQSHYVGEPKDV